MVDSRLLGWSLGSLGVAKALLSAISTTFDSTVVSLNSPASQESNIKEKNEMQVCVFQPSHVILKCAAIQLFRISRSTPHLIKLMVLDIFLLLLLSLKLAISIICCATILSSHLLCSNSHFTKCRAL